MYFDFDYHAQVVRHVWGMRGHAERGRLLFRLLVLVPLASLIHTLFMLLDYLFFPRLFWKEVKNPVFIVGHARSGTTLMHRLMSADGDKFSYFLYWEMFFPSLLEKKIIRALGWVDQHWLGGPIKKRLQAWDDKTFGPYRHMHNMSLWNAEEDMFVMAAAFVTQQWSLDIPLMDVIDVFHVDRMPHKKKRWLKFYKHCVRRQLLLNGGDKVHLAKNPVMSGWVKSIIDTFPDARIVVMMRDPAQCIPSVLRLVESTWIAKGWSAQEYAPSLKMLTDISFDSFRIPRDVLTRHPEVPQTVVDYRELTTAPRETTAKVYKDLQIELSPQFDAYLQAQAEREKNHNTRFEYSIDDYELSLQRVETELADFYAIYQWPRSTDQPQQSVVINSTQQP